MTALVIDASAAASWIMPSQRTDASIELASRRSEFELVAPYIFCWEMGNLLLRQSRRGLVMEVGREVLAGLDVSLHDAPASSHVLSSLLESAQENRLSLFDAAYLALALDLDAPLATRDAGLLKASALAGAPCLDLR